MHMAQNAFARCAEKVNTRKNLTLNRQAVGEVVSYCTMIAANDTLDFNRDKQERLCTEMNHRAEVYTVEMSAYGQPKAREKLRERTAPMLDKPFVLPAGQYPRKQREKDALAERRAAGDLVIRFFIEALDSMGYDRAQINSTVEEARKNYEQFLECFSPFLTLLPSFFQWSNVCSSSAASMISTSATVAGCSLPFSSVVLQAAAMAAISSGVWCAVAMACRVAGSSRAASLRMI